MNIAINLLPWRQTKKERVKKELIYQSIAVVALLTLLLGVVHLWLVKKIGHAVQMHAPLETKRKQLEEKISTFKKMEVERNKMLANATIVDYLRHKALSPLRVLDALPHAMVPNISLTHLTRSEDAFLIEGKTQDPKYIADFMRGLMDQSCLLSPQLMWVQQGTLNNESVTFQLSVKAK